jgi:hypothetical protein
MNLTICWRLVNGFGSIYSDHASVLVIVVCQQIYEPSHADVSGRLHAVDANLRVVAQPKTLQEAGA